MNQQQLVDEIYQDDMHSYEQQNNNNVSNLKINFELDPNLENQQQVEIIDQFQPIQNQNTLFQYSQITQQQNQQQQQQKKQGKFIKPTKFSCQQKTCNKEFKNKSSLKVHNYIHSGEKPYKCEKEECPKEFTQNSSLQKHTIIHKGEKPYVCFDQTCKKAFNQISNLRRHEKIHKNEKKYQCDICQKKFITSTNLKQHIQTHSDQQERTKYKCAMDSCDKEYFYSCSLKKHQLEEHIKKKKRKLILEQTKKQGINNENKDDQDKEINQSNKSNNTTENFIDDDFINVDKSEQNKDKNISNNIEILQNFFNKELVTVQHEDHVDILFNGYPYNYNPQTGKIEIHDLQLIDEQNNKQCNALSEVTHGNFEEFKQKLEFIESKYPGANLLDGSICNALICKSCTKSTEYLIEFQKKYESGLEKKQNKLPENYCTESITKKNEDSGTIKETQKQENQMTGQEEKKSIQNNDKCCSTVAEESCCKESKYENIIQEKQNQDQKDKSNCGCSNKNNSNNQEQEQNGGCCSSKTNDTDKKVDKKKICLCADTQILKHVHSPNCGHQKVYHNGHFDYLVDNQLHYPHTGHCDYHGRITVISN